MARDQLAFGPAELALFGVVIPIFPAMAGLTAVWLARLIAPKSEKNFTPAQNRALVGLLMLLVVSIDMRWPDISPAASAGIGMTFGWMGLLVPEQAANMVWETFKNGLRRWLSVQQPPMGPKTGVVTEVVPAKIEPSEALKEHARLERLEYLRKTFKLAFPNAEDLPPAPDLEAWLKSLDEAK